MQGDGCCGCCGCQCPCGCLLLMTLAALALVVMGSLIRTRQPEHTAEFGSRATKCLKRVSIHSG